MIFEIFEIIGLYSKKFILGTASFLTNEAAPGFVAAGIVLLSGILIFLMWRTVAGQQSAVNQMMRLVIRTQSDQEFAQDYASISAQIDGWPKKGPRGRLAAGWAEFRETVVEPGEGGIGVIQNSTRPDEFFNTYNLGFGLNGWRFWPGILVSLGLFLTFLGLVAALVQTGQILKTAGDGADPALMTDALSDLLSVASAKFIMSLSGLFGSIFVGIAIKGFSRLIDGPVSELAHAIEGRVQFLSLADIAQRQLGETQELRAHLSKLNAQLIEAIAKPLNDVSLRGGEAAAQVMENMGQQLSDSLADTISDAGNQMEKAAEGMRETTVGLDAVSRRVESVVQDLAKAAQALEAGATPLVATITGTADTARTIGEASLNLVEGASAGLGQQTIALSKAAEVMQAQVEAFETRAKAYDGDMENALKVYKDNLDAAMSEVQSLSEGVHGQYADALRRLQAVIEGARSFEPTQDSKPSTLEDADLLNTGDAG